MRTLLFTLILLSAFANSSYAQYNRMTNKHYKGNVKSVVEEMVRQDKVIYRSTNRYNLTGKLVYEEGDMMVDFPSGSKKFYYYNDGGQLTESHDKTLRPSGNEDTGISSKTLYVFDRSGNMVEEHDYYRDGRISNKTYYTYNDRGLVIARHSDIDTSVVHQQYDANGDMILYTNYDPDYKQNKRIVYKYDNHHNVIDERRYIGDSDEVVWQETFKYNEHNDVVLRNAFDHKAMIVSSATAYEYDSTGNPTKKTYTADDGKNGITFVYRYEYY